MGAVYMAGSVTRGSRTGVDCGRYRGIIFWQQQAVLKAQQETKGVRAFTDWVRVQPEGKKLYNRYCNR